MLVNLLLRRADKVRRDDRYAVYSLALGHFRQPHHFARRLGAGAGINRDTLVYMSNRCSDDFLLLALIQSVKLAVGAENKDAVNPIGDEMVDEPFQARQVEILV